MQGKKVFLLGYHGRRNIGDDAICVSLIETLGKLFNPETMLYVYTKEGYIKQNFRKEKGLQIRFTSSLVSALKSLINSQVVIVDGGDHLHDYGHFLKRLKIFVAFFTLAILTKVFFKKLLIINGGFRATKGISLAFLKMILSLTCCVSVRDGDSFALVSKYACKQPQRGFDTAILLDYKCQSIVDTHKKSVGFSIAPVFSNFFLKPEKDEALAKVIARDVNTLLHKAKNINLYFLAFNTDPKVGDLNIIRKITLMLDEEVLERIKLIAYSGDISDFLSKFSRLDVVVCCKYHSVIFSYLLGKPILVINYHPKNAALARKIGLSSRCLVSLEHVFAGKLGLMLPELVSSPEEFKTTLPVYEARRRALNGIQKCMACVLQ
jgi:polysaccharide pyruvyl transferase WcaK-like protein